MSAITYRREKGIPEWKIRVVRELKELFTKYPVVGIADLTGTPTNVVQKIRKKLRKQIEFKVAKKNLIIRAMREAGIELDDETLDNLLRGQIMLLFTDMNPFKLARVLEKEKVPIPAKPGMVAEKEIVIPQGETNLTPGPILSTFGKLRIQYQVRGGKIYIAKDTVVAKPGDVISEELAGLLLTLGITPFEAGIKLKAALDGGVLIPQEELYVDLEQIKNDVIEAFKEMLAVAVEAAYLEVPEAVREILVRAERSALAVAAETGFLTKDTAEAVLGKAVAEQLAVIAALGDKAKELGIEDVPVQQAPPAAEEAKAEEEKKEEEKEEGGEETDLSGLGGLFGF